MFKFSSPRNVKGFIKPIVLIGLSVATLAGCSKKDTPVNQQKTVMSATLMGNPNFVKIENAREIAKRIDGYYFQTEKYQSTIRTISSEYTVNDSLGNPTLYVFNYDNNEGYAVISSDYRYEPILAFTKSRNLLLTDTVPAMVDEWFGYTVERIMNIRANTYDDTADYRTSNARWSTVISTMRIVEPHFHPPYLEIEDPNLPPPVNPCGNIIYNEIKQPLMFTTWGQGVGYNDLVNSSLYCANSTNHKSPTGCVATAVAQIIKYWSAPTPQNYNYSLMADNYGTPETQRLMRDIGSAVNMSYSCGEKGSGANSSAVSSKLQNTFNYSSGGSYVNYNGSERYAIKNDLLANRPVYFDGHRTRENFLFVVWYRNGHAWVADGYKMTGSICSKHFWFHMNWGWDGLSNAWYYEDNWAPTNTSYNYQYNRKIIKNIYP